MFMGGALGWDLARVRVGNPGCGISMVGSGVMILCSGESEKMRRCSVFEIGDGNSRVGKRETWKEDTWRLFSRSVLKIPLQENR